MKQPEIDAIKARLAAAIQGPWMPSPGAPNGRYRVYPQYPNYGNPAPLFEPSNHICELSVESRRPDSQLAATARFIAAAPADIAARIAHNEQLAAKLELLKELGSVTEHRDTLQGMLFSFAATHGGHDEDDEDDFDDDDDEPAPDVPAAPACSQNCSSCQSKPKPRQHVSDILAPDGTPLVFTEGNHWNE